MNYGLSQRIDSNHNNLGRKRSVSSTRRYRSGEAAKLVGMPAATLRIWEQRYGVISPPTSASGQRLYSDEDVSRLRAIKLLVDNGRPIGVIARLDNEQLMRLASGAGGAPIAHDTHGATLFVVGFGGGITPDLPAGVRHESFDNVEEIPHLADKAGAASGLAVRVEALHEDTVLSIVAAAQSAHCDRVLIVYAFGTRQAIELARLAGIRLARTPDALIHTYALLSDFVQSLTHEDDASSASRQLWSRSSRRFDQDTLSKLARQSSTIACECPKHLVELVLQLAAFERYSDECMSRSPADALLHRHLGDAANKAVALFEDALAAVVEHEGWSL
ncbi:HTH-type transcriptional regulator MlrA [Pandoraea anapnoica]|uniref:HTH-type transcriptional regulator MlrA n=1 Tax=Pandoraea anapnoica TaxID=2508301 RepID=A0A5E4ZY38_9BURK|nr:MerR family transcriptional regulator [Pandoraea anapnoica]VVE65442.1 HTH-type transcriptional regulator MlrA [Pandoraea anapnoica]